MAYKVITKCTPSEMPEKGSNISTSKCSGKRKSPTFLFEITANLDYIICFASRPSDETLK